MGITLDDVACKAGVSRGTVSLVLNNRHGARIGDETRKRIYRVAHEMGYEPNLFARSLSMKRTNTIGLIIPGLKNAFFAEVMDASEREAQAAGYQALLDGTPLDDAPGAEIAHKLRGWQFDGVLVYTIRGLSAEDVLGPQAARIPAVYLGGTPSDLYDRVVFDLYGGAVQLVEHLIARGYRRIAYVSPFDPDIERTREPRYLAYAEICRRAGLPVRFIRTTPNVESREAGLATATLIAREPSESRPDALVCHNDIVAIGAYCGLRRADVRVPEDIAVAGFDGLQEGQYLVRPLTTVVTPTQPFCKAGIELLVERMRGSAPVAARIVTIPATLRIGGTT